MNLIKNSTCFISLNFVISSLDQSKFKSAEQTTFEENFYQNQYILILSELVPKDYNKYVDNELI